MDGDRIDIGAGRCERRGTAGLAEPPSPMNFNGTTIDRMTKLVWEGRKLLLITTSKVEGQSIEFKSAWSLTADGALATETTFPDFQGGGAPITLKATYKKG